MRILFCNVAWMERYNGVNADKPENGGSWVNEHNNAIEGNNFTERSGHYYGYVSTKSNEDKVSQIRIERLDGVSKKDDQADGVLVVWVAKRPHGKNTIVGWYTNATVLRHRNEEDKTSIFAKKENCVLLPMKERTKIVPRATKDSFGMGQSNIWYGKKDDEAANRYINNIYEYINSYCGENIAWE